MKTVRCHLEQVHFVNVEPRFEETEFLRRDEVDLIFTKKVRSFDNQDRSREKSFQSPRKPDRCESKSIQFHMKQDLLQMKQNLVQMKQDLFQLNQVTSQRKKTVRQVKIGAFARKEFTVGVSQARRLRKEVSGR
jgi:hypothetical protein